MRHALNPSRDHQSQGLTYRREIDGLRALSILAVVLYHAGLPGLSGGFRGVDIFFVISGYLITRMLFVTSSQRGMDLRDFYERRARRILPALEMMLLCSTVAAVLLMQPDELRIFCRELGGAVLLSANFVYWQTSGYFNPLSDWMPLLHTWSLAVEEQFYLLWPLLLLPLLRISPRRVPVLLVALALLALIVAQLLDTRLPRLAFYLLPGRAWELLAGACVAGMERRGVARPGPRTAIALSGLGLLAVFASLLWPNPPHGAGLAALPVVLGTALLLQALPAAPAFSQCLGAAPLRWLGLSSYSIYLWHQPLGAWLRYAVRDEPPLALRLTAAGLAVIIGLASWRWLEQPLRDRRRVPLRPFLIGITVSTLLLAGFAAAGFYTKGFESLFLRYAPTSHQAIYRSLSREEYPLLEGRCRFMPHGLANATAERIRECFHLHGSGLLVMGDSRAQDLYRAMLLSSSQPFIVGLAYPGCQAEWQHKKSCGYDRLLDLLQQQPDSFAVVLYTQAGFHLMKDSKDQQPSRNVLADPRSGMRGLRIDPMRVNAQLPLLKELQRAGPLVYWLGPLMEPHRDPQQLRRMALDCSPSGNALRPHLQQAFQSLDQKLALRLANPEAAVRYLSAQQRMQFDPNRDVFDCRRLLWRDGDHWSPAGEVEFGRRLLRSLADEPPLAALLPSR
ncbi:acyltransferase family protein [Solimonas sp. SE-A11]|uniref:acyltransferase family protein n=1 Tax=Solimonas sp. SE-A11 TaxID=3054954 RepID=UPI00259D098C|nr:acyltransferase family protein [Solimonas sp. SE-A11]MDM4772582.1 acyltransferase family protein [Solimonas sp. SE-A11]